jgi:hypothetical protein|tara:strand:+ start:219 stop:767 length:549 start_codon:yes stop_codon:yes gene_type:complete
MGNKKTIVSISFDSALSEVQHAQTWYVKRGNEDSKTGVKSPDVNRVQSHLPLVLLVNEDGQPVEYEGFTLFAAKVSHLDKPRECTLLPRDSWGTVAPDGDDFQVHLQTVTGSVWRKTFTAELEAETFGVFDFSQEKKDGLEAAAKAKKKLNEAANSTGIDKATLKMLMALDPAKLQALLADD